MSMRRRWITVVGGALVVGSMIALSACASEPDVAPSPSSAPETSAPEPYDGPIVFVGDELDAFALTPDEIVGILPEASDVEDPSPVLEQISDGGGLPADPAICDALYAEQSLGSVGARVIEWKVPTDPDYGFGRLSILQFADEAHAQTRMDQLMRAAEQCAEFTKEAPATFDAAILDEVEHVRAFAGTLEDTGAGYDWRAFNAFASTGNVIVQLWQPFTGDRVFDAEPAAMMLQTRAAEARAELIDELTENPPMAEEDPSGDPGAVWSEWSIGVGGVGPLRLGDSLDAALAAAGENVQVVGPDYDGGPSRLVAPDGGGSILVQPAEGADAVLSITVGDSRVSGEALQDGTVLPARGDVRIGSPVADAIAAFPGGTIVDVESSEEYFYAVATRDGQVFRFHADRDIVDVGATVIGITVEDATAQQDAVFG